MVDIREHYPLMDLDKREKDEDLQLDSFRDRQSGTPFVLTTTFLLTMADSKGHRRQIARSLRVASDLEKRSVMVKLEIERRYWSRQGIEWHIVTQRDIPAEKAKNIEWLHSCRGIQSSGISGEDAETLLTDFIAHLSDNPLPIRKVTAGFDQEHNLDSGSGLLLFKHLLAAKYATVDMDKPIDLEAPATTVKIITSKEWGKDASHQFADRMDVG